MGDLFLTGTALILLQSIAFLVFLVVKDRFTHSRFMRFLGILGIGVASSLIAAPPLGTIIGFPSVLLASILVSIILDNENTKSEVDTETTVLATDVVSDPYSTNILKPHLGHKVRIRVDRVGE